MSTNGFISFIANSEAKNAYSHWDSGPYELGIKVLHWLGPASAQPDQLKAAITRLKVVSDDDGPRPTPEEVNRFQLYGDRDVGDPAMEWYALLHGTQGDPTAILACGYVVYEDDPFGWIYEVNADERSFAVNYDDENRVTWPWSALPTDDQFLAEANQLESEEESDEEY
jgi:hypothetical protein